MIVLEAAEPPRTVAEIMESAPDDAWRTIDPENLMLIETGEGTITVMLSSALAQDHVAQARLLARADYYEGLSFYRVIEGFVAQGGDHTDEKDKGGAQNPLGAEFEEPLPEGVGFDMHNAVDGYAPQVGWVGGIPAGRDPEAGTAWLAHCTGAYAYGRNNDKDSASTEFYITLQPQRYLDRNLTVMGQVIGGMNVVQAAPRGVVDADPETDDFEERLRLEGMTIAADLPKDERPAWQIMDTGSETFHELVRARSARPSEFFYHRPDHVDLCAMQVPVRKTSG
jgi:peptidylprolyl isomerase